MGALKDKIRRRVGRHGLRGGRAGKVRPQVLRAGALHPEARLDHHVVVVLDAVVDSGIQREVGDIGHGEIVVIRASSGEASGIRRRAALGDADHP